VGFCTTQPPPNPNQLLKWQINIYGTHHNKELTLADRNIIIIKINSYNNTNNQWQGLISDIPLDGLFSILFLFSTTTTTSCALAFFWGATQSTIWCLATRIISDMLGLQSLAGALGILTAVRGVACSIGPPAGAWLDYRTGSIRNVFWLSGLLAVLGSIFILISWIFKKYQDKRTEKQDNQRPNYGSINWLYKTLIFCQISQQNQHKTSIQIWFLHHV